MSEQQQPGMDETVSPPVEEIDLREKDIYQLHDFFSQEIKQRNVLHGNQVPALEVLDPMTSTNAGVGTETAVFATDMPFLSLARAAGGADLMAWTRNNLLNLQHQK